MTAIYRICCSMQMKLNKKLKLRLYQATYMGHSFTSERRGHCKHASTRRQESSSTPSKMFQLSFQVYANNFRSVWTTTQINREECYVCMGKSASQRSIPNHQEYDQLDTSRAQILWRSQWNHHPMRRIRVLTWSHASSERAACGVCVKVIVSCRAPICTNRKRVLGDSFCM